jgi:type I restriction enzyme S subunit
MESIRPNRPTRYLFLRRKTARNHNLEEQAQALYKSWFVDFEPFKGEEYIESEIGMIPSSCKVLRLQDVCELITKGTTPTSLGLRFSDDGIPFVKVESISDAHTLDEGKFAFIAAEANEALSRSKIKSGDILFTIAGTLGRFCLVPKRISQANTNQAVSIIRVDQTILPVEYVYSLLLGGYHIDYCTRNIQQAVQANLSLGTLKNLPIIIPRPDKLEQYCLTVMQLINGIELKKDETRLLSISRDSILPKLMSGCLSC